MKNLIIYSILVSCFPVIAAAQSMEIDIQKYDYDSQDFNYSRLNLYFLGATVPYEMQEDSTYKVELISTLMVHQGEEIVLAERHRLTSEAEYPTDFTDSHNLSLKPGEYDLTYKVKLEGSDETLYEKKRKLSIKEFSRPAVSDIMILQSFKESKDESKANVINGVEVEILPFSYVPDAFNKLSYFFEYYAGETTDVFLLEHIDKYEKGKWETRSKTASPLQNIEGIRPFFKSMRIEDLESGEYRIVVDIVTRSMDTLASSERYFIRSNPRSDMAMKEKMMTRVEKGTFVDSLTVQELRYNLRAISSIVPENEVLTLNYVLKQDEEKGMKVFLYNFWKNYAPINTEIAYEEFMKVVDAVNLQYNSGMGYGFETDRGRVFLRYGRPTSITTSEQEIASVPYEIWTYDYVERTKQSDRRFVFYNPSLVPNGYELLHSTVRGEIENPRWELYIYQHAPDEIDGQNFMDSRRMQDNINRNARRFYEDN